MINKNGAKILYRLRETAQKVATLRAKSGLDFDNFNREFQRMLKAGLIGQGNYNYIITQTGIAALKEWESKKDGEQAGLFKEGEK